MATKDKKKGGRKPRAPRRSRAASPRRKSIGGMVKGKIRWGEAILAAIVGYEGNKIIEPISEPFYDKFSGDPRIGSVINAISAPTGDFAKGVNKALGTVAVAKVAYDAVTKRSLDQNDLSLYIPYTLGTVFDAPGGSGNSKSEVW